MYTLCHSCSLCVVNGDYSHLQDDQVSVIKSWLNTTGVWLVNTGADSSAGYCECCGYMSFDLSEFEVV